MRDVLCASAAVLSLQPDRAFIGAFAGNPEVVGCSELVDCGISAETTHTTDAQVANIRHSF